jgi:hypothetical protein
MNHYKVLWGMMSPVRAPFSGVESLSALGRHINQAFRHIGTGANRFDIGFIGYLGLDQPDELIIQVNV